MDLELGDNMIKRTRGDDEDDSACEVWIGKDREEEVLSCRETPSMFILCVHLQGYCKRDSIKIISIKEEGRDEEKPIQKLEIIGEVMSKKHHEQILGFRKVFKIPNGVVQDQIKAKYNEEESVLKICMPKSVKQICGVQIEEVKEQEEFGESSHKVIKEFKVHLIENPKYGESDEREEDGKEETGEEVKNSEVEPTVEDRIAENIGEESQQVSNKSIVIQSLEESDNGGLLGPEVDEEIMGGRKENEIEDTKGEEDIISKDDTIEGRKLKEIEDRDVEVKEGTEESDTFVDERIEEEFENTKGGSNQIAEEIGEEGSEEATEIKVKEVPKEPKEPLQVEYESDITEGEEQGGIEEPMLFGHVKYETCCEEGSQAKTMKRVVEGKEKVEAFEDARVNEEKGKTYNNEECGDERGDQESQVPKKQDYDVKLLMRSSQLESPLGPHEVIGERKSTHGGHEIEVEVDEHGDDEVQREISQELEELKDIQVEASEEEEKANEQREGVYVEISKEIDHELEDIRVEAREEDNQAKEQRDEVYVEIISSQEVQERRESQFKENDEERKKLHGPLFVAGSALVVSLVVFLVRHRRVEKR